MQEACANCRFWTPWREVMLGADVPRFIGHCVITQRAPVAGYEHVVHTIQGLTGDDFRCVAYQAAD